MSALSAADQQLDPGRTDRCACCQGAVATGVWVIAHECGHQAFSKWQAVNDGFGLVLHSVLLVPYYSWCGLARHIFSVACGYPDCWELPYAAPKLAEYVVGEQETFP